jgi:F-type H+-transporting ATPase subunit beta
LVDRPLTVAQVLGVRGSVIDIAFPDGDLPAINEALEIAWDRAWRLTAEVQSHLDPLSVRAVAMQNSSGLSRGTAVHRLGGPLRVPVGDAVLGRVLNAFGEPLDHDPPLPEESPRWPIQACNGFIY